MTVNQISFNDIPAPIIEIIIDFADIESLLQLSQVNKKLNILGMSALNRKFKEVNADLIQKCINAKIIKQQPEIKKTPFKIFKQAIRYLRDTASFSRCSPKQAPADANRIIWELNYYPTLIKIIEDKEKKKANSGW